MKGLIVLALCLLSLGTQAAMTNEYKREGGRVRGLETHDGIIIKNLNLQEGTKVLKSLEEGEAIEIREQIIYPEEVSHLIWGRLTEPAFTAKRPNQPDYN